MKGGRGGVWESVVGGRGCPAKRHGGSCSIKDGGGATTTLCAGKGGGGGSGYGIDKVLPYAYVAHFVDFFSFLWNVGLFLGGVFVLSWFCLVDVVGAVEEVEVEEEEEELQQLCVQEEDEAGMELTKFSHVFMYNASRLYTKSSEARR